MKNFFTPATMLRILVGLTITVLISCKKEIKEVAVPETTTINSLPLATGSPLINDKEEDSSASLFPGQSLANARTDVAGVTDFVNFSDEMALTILPDYAASTFATAPFYIQQVGTAWIHVKENNSGNYKPAFKSNYGHFHLSYQNFVPCITSNGPFGKPTSGGGCAVINPVKEPRVLDTHDGNEWIKIYAYDYSSPSRIFDLLSIKVTNGPIQLWFKKSNGDWLHWSSIGVATWNLSAHCTSIKEVLISSTGNSSSIGFDNLKVMVPYN